MFDHRKVYRYTGKGIHVETIKCTDSGELIVSIRIGDLILGKRTVSQFTRDQALGLKEAGVAEIRREAIGREVVLWGVKQRQRPDSGALNDYVTLVRRCIRVEVPDNEDVCGLMFWYVEYVRSDAEKQ